MRISISGMPATSTRLVTYAPTEVYSGAPASVNDVVEIFHESLPFHCGWVPTTPALGNTLTFTLGSFGVPA